MSDNLRVLLVGAGGMATEYAKVLNSLRVPYEVVGRGEDNSVKFERTVGISVQRGGIEKAVFGAAPSHAIIAVGIEQLEHVTESVLQRGVSNVLVEKPGGLCIKDIEHVCRLVEKDNHRVYVAYNRRFYASVKKALEIIEEDGGVSSFSFEFTEWSHVIESLGTSSSIKEEWIYANSSHVIDLAFFLGGWPREMTCFTKGELPWHKKGSVFSGAGISDKGAVFSYHADWGAPGRWSVEILTKKHRLYFRPMEQLQIQKKGSVKIDFVDIDDKLDKEYKPGLYEEVNAFLNIPNDPRLTTIHDQLKKWKVFEKIEKGSD